MVRQNKKQKLCAKGVSLLFWICVLAPTIASAQTQPEPVTGELQLNVSTVVNGEETGLPRKRFFLINGSLEENKGLLTKISAQSFSTRECFYLTAHASPEFIKWLIDGDCESVYCRLIDEKYISGPAVVKEFREAYDNSAKEYKSPELRRLWLTTYLTDVIRDGFYRQRQDAIKALIGETKSGVKNRVNSVMTDSTGTAFFTDLTPGTYLISNLIPTEIGANSHLWTCEVNVTPGKNALVIPSKENKCVVIEKLVPVCNANKQTTSIR